MEGELFGLVEARKVGLNNRGGETLDARLLGGVHGPRDVNGNGDTEAPARMCESPAMIPGRAGRDAAFSLGAGEILETQKGSAQLE